jgi:glycerol-3-phosphate dehydrogenase (NAD(P)+)
VTSPVILGAGSWGTALALALGRRGVPVSLWGRNGAALDTIRETRENDRYLPGHKLPAMVEMQADLATAARGRDFIIVAVPSAAVREVMLRVAETDQLALLPCLMAAKGLEPQTAMRPTEIGHAVLGPDARMAALSGPNLAKELAAGFPTATVIASRDREMAAALQHLMISPTLRVYTGSDVIGVELAGALKNVLAIGGGMSDGLGYRDNTKAALLTRGLAEIARLGAALGAAPATFMGLAGVGDLFATAVSRYSRNYRVGFAVGKGVPLAEALRQVAQVAEGVPTARAAMLLAERCKVEMPLFAATAAVLEGTLSPARAVEALMQRAPKPE